MTPDSVSEWLGRLKSGEAEAAQRLWDRYAVRLVALAGQKLAAMPKTVADEEDVAQSVFGSVCRGAAAGRFAEVKNRDELWWLLLAITRQKVVDHIRRESAQKRGLGRVHPESDLQTSAEPRAGFSLDQLVGDEPTPEFLAILEEQHQRLLGLLRDDRLRHIATCRIEGYTVAEIAARLGISTRAVERKLQLIRAKWAKDLSSNAS